MKLPRRNAKMRIAPGTDPGQLQADLAAALWRNEELAGELAAARKRDEDIADDLAEVDTALAALEARFLKIQLERAALRRAIRAIRIEKAAILTDLYEAHRRIAELEVVVAQQGQALGLSPDELPSLDKRKGTC